MDKVEQYRGVIHSLLAEYRDFLTSQTKTDVETEVVRNCPGHQMPWMKWQPFRKG